MAMESMRSRSRIPGCGRSDRVDTGRGWWRLRIAPQASVRSAGTASAEPAASTTAAAWPMAITSRIGGRAGVSQQAACPPPRAHRKLDRTWRWVSAARFRARRTPHSASAFRSCPMVRSRSRRRPITMRGRRRTTRRRPPRIGMSSRSAIASRSRLTSGVARSWRRHRISTASHSTFRARRWSGGAMIALRTCGSGSGGAITMG